MKTDSREWTASLRTMGAALMIALSMLLMGPAVSTQAAMADITAEDQAAIAAASAAQTTGIVTIGGNIYCFEGGALVTSSWRDSGGARYYFTADGRAAVGSCKVDGTFYIFKANGTLATGSKKHTEKVDGETYVASKGGKAVKGKVTVKKNGKSKTYTTNKKGKVKKSSSGYSSALKKVMESTVNRITKSGMSKSAKLRACWNYIVGGSFHYASKYPNTGSGGWQRGCALNMLRSHSGNCYGFACAFAALATQCGYKAYVVCGRVPGTRDGAADGYTRHCWVKINGAHYDPEGQYAGWGRGIYGAGGGAGYITSTVAF